MQRPLSSEKMNDLVDIARQLSATSINTEPSDEQVDQLKLLFAAAGDTKTPSIPNAEVKHMFKSPEYRERLKAAVTTFDKGSGASMQQNTLNIDATHKIQKYLEEHPNKREWVVDLIRSNRMSNKGDMKLNQVWAIIQALHVNNADTANSQDTATVVVERSGEIRVVYGSFVFTFDTCKCDHNQKVQCGADITEMMQNQIPMATIIENVYHKHGVDCVTDDKSKTPPCTEFSSDVSREDFVKHHDGCKGAPLTPMEKVVLVVADYEIKCKIKGNAWAEAHDTILDARNGQYPSDWYEAVVQKEIFKEGRGEEYIKEAGEHKDLFGGGPLDKTRLEELTTLLSQMKAEWRIRSSASSASSAAAASSSSGAMPSVEPNGLVINDQTKLSDEDLEAIKNMSRKDVAKLAHSHGLITDTEFSTASRASIKMLKVEECSQDFARLFMDEIATGILYLSRLWGHYRAKVCDEAQTLKECLELSMDASKTFGKMGFAMPYHIAQRGFDFENCDRKAFIPKTMRFETIDVHATFSIVIDSSTSTYQPNINFSVDQALPEYVARDVLKRTKFLINQTKNEVCGILDVKANREAESNMRSVIQAEDAIKAEEERKKSAEYQEEVRQRNSKARAKEKERAEERKKRLEEEAKIKAEAEEQAKREVQQLFANSAIHKAIELANAAFANGNPDDAKNRLRVATTKHAPNATDEVRASLKAAKEKLFPPKKAPSRDDVGKFLAHRVQTTGVEPPPELTPPVTVQTVKNESNSQRKARRKREKEAEEAAALERAKAEAEAKAQAKAKEEAEKEAVEAQKRLMTEFEAAKGDKGGKGGKGIGGRGGRGGRGLGRESTCSAPSTAAIPSPDEKLCVICMDEESTHVNVPCGHACLCQGCAALLDSKGGRECPTCRGPVSMRMRVFF